MASLGSKTGLLHEEDLGLKDVCFLCDEIYVFERSSLMATSLLVFPMFWS